MENEVFITASHDLPNTFYIFRDNGIELKVIKQGSDLFCRWNLRPEEIEYLKNINIKIPQ